MTHKVISSFIDDAARLLQENKKLKETIAFLEKELDRAREAAGLPVPINIKKLAFTGGLLPERKALTKQK